MILLEATVERRSIDAWQRRNRDGSSLPPVLYFDRRKPQEFDELGLYVGFIDFRHVQRQLGYADVPLTTCFHSLVYHFSRSDDFLYELSQKQLYHNPSNSSAWNETAYTYRYFLNGTTLLDYSNEPIAEERKIPGIGKRGRALIRAVLLDEPEPSDEELFGNAPADYIDKTEV